MSRRYLTMDEAEAAIRRGKNVEVFLGGFESNGQRCIKWASINSGKEGFVGKVWESIDEGSPDFIDIYSFSPVSGEWDVPTRSEESASLSTLLDLLGCPSNKLVNAGVVQDEYTSYIAAGT